MPRGSVVNIDGTRQSTEVDPMARRPYKDIFLTELKKQSGDEQKLVNNGTLRSALGWEPERYWRIKDELVAENSLIASHGGPGGAVSLADVPGTKTPPALHVFVSYSHQDEEIKNEFLKHLSPLKRRNLIADWHDRKIEAGTQWEHIISENLKNADIIVLLISIDFINSDYCYDIEMETALDRESAGQAVIIPVIARSCMWKQTRFSAFQALPTDGKAIATWPYRDEALTVVAEGIQQVAERLLSKR